MKLLSDNRGIALLITLSVTTLLVAVAIEYNRRARFSVISTAMARNRVSLTQMATAGIHAGMAILAGQHRVLVQPKSVTAWAFLPLVFRWF